MKQRALLSLLLVLFLGTEIPAQQTKTFPEADCSFTLPGDDWEWLDPKTIPDSGGKITVLVLARNRKGLAFTLTYANLNGNEKGSQREFEAFEKGFLESGKMTKMGSKQIAYKGLQGYQLDARTQQGQGVSVRILYANKKLYNVQVINGLGPLGPDTDTESIFQNFNFTRQPEPVGSSGFGPSNSSWWKPVLIFVILIVVACGVGGVALLVVLSKGKKKNRRRPREDDWDEWDD
jgi:hypothetical protein